MMSPLPTAPALLRRNQEAQLRTAFLHETLRALYPADGDAVREYLVLPHAGRPRLLVPAGARRVAAAAVRYGVPARSWRAWLVRAGATAALRTGIARPLLPDRVRVTAAGSVERHLQEMLGEELFLAIHIGPARANRKPVAQLLDPAGRPIGFVKVGIGELTRRLVRTETAALTALSHLRLRHLTVPRVRHAGPWDRQQLLVQSAVPAWRRRAQPCPHRLARAMYEIAHCCGVTSGPLQTSTYWKRLSESVSAVALAGADGAALADAVTALGRHAGDLPLQYGAWHGDWAPWNLAALPETLVVWDWERFAVGVPVGFDAIHYDLQRRLESESDAAGAVAATLAAADRLLAPFDVAPAARRPTALLYLADLAARYLADRQAEAGARLGVLGTWLLPVLTEHLQELP